MKKILPYISIIGIAAFVGNMLVIGFGFGSYWQTLEPMEFMKQFTLQFPNLLPPTMGIILPALIATIALVVQTKGQKEVRKNWSFALAGLVIACTITSVYHLPANLGFMESAYSAEEAVSKLNWWMRLHWVRTITVFAAAIFAVKAFKLATIKTP
ncbi:anthrone oxygenase family protein [Cyclobacterium plantarum]|uniref:anthrone oxygenase family protein n=1 Tax=Cyclobacterium plantarum TaxID=2716263 RepID=UPI003F6F0781